MSKVYRQLYILMLGGFVAACSPPSEPIDLWETQTIQQNCFSDVFQSGGLTTVYDDYEPVVGRHCSGTNHQSITDVEKVVYLGDSITEGTPPTLEHEYYRNRLTRLLDDQFGEVEVARCSAFGARVDDLLKAPHQQILECFPAIEEKRTLVVMTIGGNDMFEAAQRIRDGATEEDLDGLLQNTYQDISDALHWFDDNSDQFPNGVFVVFSNIYEFTDATADMAACPSAELFGFAGQVPEVRPSYIWINQQYMKLAVETQRDMLFTLEQFCGHGFYHDDPTNECYRGPGSERWFDDTCIHPTPAGHDQLANMFMDVVLE